MVRLLFGILFFFSVAFARGQIITGAEIYGNPKPFIGSHEGLQTIFDKAGYRYTFVRAHSTLLNNGSLFIDSAGQQVEIKVPSDTGLAHDNAFIILVFDPNGRYLHNMQILAWHTTISYLLSRFNAEFAPDYIGSPFSQCALSVCPDGGIAFGFTYTGADSFDLIGANKQRFARFRNSPMLDSTMLITGKLHSDGSFKWANSIRRNRPFPAGSMFKMSTRSIRGIATQNTGNIAFDMELYDIFNPYTDTLILTDKNGLETPILVNKNDITLNFNASGVLLNTGNPFTLKYVQSANNIAVQQTVSDGEYKYSLIKTNATLIDILEQYLIDTGERVFIVKRDFSDNLIWLKEIGKGQAGFYQLAHNAQSNQLCVGFNFLNTNYIFKTPLALPTASLHGLYLSRFDTSGQLVWQKASYEGTGILLGLNFLKNNAFLLALHTGGVVKVDTFQFAPPAFNKRKFIAIFDSTNTCRELKQLQFANQLGYLGSNFQAVTIDGGFFGNYYAGCGNNFVNRDGIAYITGTLEDSLKISCNSYLYTLSGDRDKPYRDQPEAFVLKISPSVIFKKSDTATCKSIVSPSGRYVYNNSGIYSDTIFNISGCDTVKVISEITLKVVPLELKVSKSNDISCSVPSAELTASGGNSIQWQPSALIDKPNEFKAIAQTTQPTFFKATVQDTLGCSATDSIFIDIIHSDSLGKTGNVITPNDDGINDCFSLNQLGLLKRVDMQIFNRWGNLVYKINNSNDCWNGINQQGEHLANGTYYYILSALTSCDLSIKQRGSITVLK